MMPSCSSSVAYGITCGAGAGELSLGGEVDCQAFLLVSVGGLRLNFATEWRGAVAIAPRRAGWRRPPSAENGAPCCCIDSVC
jgi:hypothetical protein